MFSIINKISNAEIYQPTINKYIKLTIIVTKQTINVDIKLEIK